MQQAVLCTMLGEATAVNMGQASTAQPVKEHRQLSHMYRSAWTVVSMWLARLPQDTGRLHCSQLASGMQACTVRRFGP